MPEKFSRRNPEHQQFNDDEYHHLLSRVENGIDGISRHDYGRLVQFGYHWLDDKGNTYEAMRVFEAVQDFQGLRKIADVLLREQPDSFDLPRVLNDLEDQENIRNILNRGEVALRERAYERAFDSLNEPLYEYIGRFLEENGALQATGMINEGIDLVAIRNLAREYDIAVPIARGGLKQGAIAHFWGMPTRIIDIAAHKRKVPKGEWINPVAPEDFNGKRVLLFDKDAVTGSSVQKTVSMLEPFRIKSIGVYFTHPVLEPGSDGIGTITDGLPKGLKIFSPGNAPLEHAGDIYLEAHERLETLYGRRRKAERQFIEEAGKVQERFPELADALRAFASKQFHVFDFLNPYVPGMPEVRERILAIVNRLYRDHRSLLDDDMYRLPGVAENFRRISATTQAPPRGFESVLITARYKKEGEEAARRRNVENFHYPSNPLAAFDAARKAVGEDFDAALIVGPEGFAYEPYFRDFGLPTAAVNIPESGEDESRTIRLFDDASTLRGKRVLVVEDDVHTGATLRKLLEWLMPQNPARLGLYLGQPEQFQRVTKIPQAFAAVYLAEENPASGKIFEEYLASRNLKIYKNAGVSPSVSESREFLLP